MDQVVEQFFTQLQNQAAILGYEAKTTKKRQTLRLISPKFESANPRRAPELRCTVYLPDCDSVYAICIQDVKYEKYVGWVLEGSPRCELRVHVEDLKLPALAEACVGILLGESVKMPEIFSDPDHVKYCVSSAAGEALMQNKKLRDEREERKRSYRESR